MPAHGSPLDKQPITSTIDHDDDVTVTPSRHRGLKAVGALAAVTFFVAGCGNGEARSIDTSPSPVTASQPAATPGANNLNPNNATTPIEQGPFAGASSSNPKELLNPSTNPDHLLVENYTYTVNGEKLTYEELVQRWSLHLDPTAAPKDKLDTSGKIGLRYAKVLEEYLNTGCAPADIKAAPADRFHPSEKVSGGCPSVAAFLYGSVFKKAIFGDANAPLDEGAEALYKTYHAGIAGYNQTLTQKGLPPSVKVSVELYGSSVLDAGKDMTDAAFSSDFSYAVILSDNVGDVMPDIAARRTQLGAPKNIHTLIGSQGTLEKDPRYNWIIRNPQTLGSTDMSKSQPHS